MRARTALASALVLSVWLGRAAPADAHRLDEYLQATRLAIEVERVSLEIDLTPGASVAPQVFAAIDTDQDGQIARAEAVRYARVVLSAVALSVDDTPVALALEDSQFPEREDMNLGLGMIRLRATAMLPSSAAGRHHLAYANNHRPVESVYLVNALEPATPRIEISQPLRDAAQQGLTLNYRVALDPRWARLWWSLTGVAMGGLLVCARWRRAAS